MKKTDRHKPSRHEKKLRKDIAKIGMKLDPRIARVTFLNDRNMLFVVTQAEVYKGVDDTYVVFGSVQVEELSAQAQMTAAEQFKGTQPKLSAPSSFMKPAKLTQIEVEKAEEANEADETGLNIADIELVMQQAGATRVEAVRALRKNNNDIVDAIMELTMSKG